MNNTICSITTINAPLNQTISFVNYHLNIGIDKMFLFFDNPKDEAIEILKDYKKVICFKCDDEHWNNQGVTNKISIERKQKLNSKIVLEKKYDWVIHIDSDELIYLKKPLKEFLNKISKDTDFMRLVTMEALPEKTHYKNRLEEVDLFKINIPKISKRYFMGNSAGKSITRISNRIEDLGIHTPNAKNGYNLKHKFSLTGRILHYDCCGFEDWESKWKKRTKGETVAREMGARRKNILFQFEKELKRKNKDGLIRLYKAQFFISENKKKILMFFGLIKRIKLDDWLFDTPLKKEIKKNG